LTFGVLFIGVDLELSVFVESLFLVGGVDELRISRIAVGVEGVGGTGEVDGVVGTVEVASVEISDMKLSGS
jgi:hypothetical protein